MEPMSLGSPGSPATNPNYLPSYLMGETQVTTPRNNTLSPNKGGSGGRSLSFAASPTSPQDFNRSALGQRTLFGANGGYQHTPTTVGNIGGLPMQAHNATSSGPPTQGLFDALRQERNQVHTPIRSMNTTQPNLGTPTTAQNINAYGMNQQNYQQPPQPSTPYNDSYLNNSSLNASRGIVSPLAMGSAGYNTAAYMQQCPPAPRYSDFWVTVYGFPSSATSIILQHFAQCGTIVDKVFPPMNGNWVHLKYSSPLECDRALNFNEKILGNNIMVGVTHCKDKNLIDKENVNENVSQTPKVRPLAQAAYKSSQNDLSVIASPSAPQKSSGIMNKAMDLFFGW